MLRTGVANLVDIQVCVVVGGKRVPPALQPAFNASCLVTILFGSGFLQPCWLLFRQEPMCLSTLTKVWSLPESVSTIGPQRGFKKVFPVDIILGSKMVLPYS